ncbi:hypothetical protein ACQUQQ_08705 [Acidithiobacillus ferrooxidans]|uniref:hypothetical protein n=1 Tax=Acidithiobacillus ferrooxidans TaxID=920 RepID=UPI000A5DB672
MDKTSGNPNGNGKEQEREKQEDRQRIIDAMIPAGLTGQIREKARDAAMTAMMILGMSRTDILDRVQEIARENGLTPQSARAWLLFGKEIQDKATDVGRDVGDKGSRRTFATALGYGKHDTGTIGLGAVFRREVTGTGIGKNAADDMRRDLNREAGHHGDSIGGRKGAFSYDQMVDGWGGGGMDGHRGAGAAGLDGQDGDADLDMEIEGDFGSDGAQVDFDEEERLPGASVMTPRDLGEVHLADGARRDKSGRVVDRSDVFRASQGGQARRNPRAVQMELAEHAVAALNRKMGGFRWTDEEFAAFAKANTGLDKNQLRLLRKGLTDTDYLGFRVYVENGHLLNDKGRGGDRISTRTRACLLMASEDSARRFQNSLRAKIRLLSRIPDPGMATVSIEHAKRMGESLARLTEAHQARVENGEIRNRIGTRKAGKKQEEPGLER